MASLPGGFAPPQQHEAARKFGARALHAALEKAHEAEDGKSFLTHALHDADTGELKHRDRDPDRDHWDRRKGLNGRFKKFDFVFK